MKVLDGRRLAAERAPLIAGRAEAVRGRRGRRPSLLIMAFAEEGGRAPHVQGKLRACAATGIDPTPLIVRAAARTEEAVAALRAAVAEHEPDGVFVQVPFPAGVDGDVVAAAIPAALDVDVMAPENIGRYLAGAMDVPPVTVTAALELLAAHDVSIRGLRSVVIAEASSFATMFCTALRRQDARVEAVEPQAPALAARVGDAEVVVAAAGRPGLLTSGMLARGAVAIDVGYFNEGGRGDIDLTPGVDHLAAVMPVPGGIGPMTVSALLERTVHYAER